MLVQSGIASIKVAYTNLPSSQILDIEEHM